MFVHGEIVRRLSQGLTTAGLGLINTLVGLFRNHKFIQPMTHFDVFNGDADGICALHQLRLAEPRESELVTGVKRDINLVRRVAAKSGDSVTVLDISLDKNRDELKRVLNEGAAVQYFDHHFAGEIPVFRVLGYSHRHSG